MLDMLLRVPALVVALGVHIAHAAPGQCHVVDIDFTPTDKLQLAAWVEDTAGHYIDTIFITQQTGTYGIGNRPGRFDFNSGPIWPYGRRETVFPIWAHRHGQTFPRLVFQDGDDNDLSHQLENSSSENHFCRPMMDTEPAWDTGTCASQAFTDKGTFAATGTSLYPPRSDLSRTPGTDSVDVEMYAMLNTFDAVSQATPPGGMPATITWPIPADLAAGSYVMFVEAALEFDFNDTYSVANYPAPTGIPWSTYGEPYRGQPSIVYQVPFTIGTTETIADAQSYAGYGDPDGQDGMLRAPDTTITTDTPGSGASRLQIVSDGQAMYRVRVDSRPETDNIPPGMPTEPTLVTTDGRTADLTFVAPGDDGNVGRVRGYEIRLRASTPITEDNFADSTPVSATVTPDDPGSLQSFTVDGLLPETDYYVGIRAFDDCHNDGPVAVVKFTTPERPVGSVDACFVATAAYGSVMANDVRLLRRFRDLILRNSVLGELAVEGYYTFGPAVAAVVGESDLLRASARDLLAPIVARVKGVKL